MCKDTGSCREWQACTQQAVPLHEKCCLFQGIMMSEWLASYNMSAEILCLLQAPCRALTCCVCDGPMSACKRAQKGMMEPWRAYGGYFLSRLLIIFIRLLLDHFLFLLRPHTAVQLALAETGMAPICRFRAQLMKGHMPGYVFPFCIGNMMAVLGTCRGWFLV